LFRRIKRTFEPICHAECTLTRPNPVRVIRQEWFDPLNGDFDFKMQPCCSGALAARQQLARSKSRSLYLNSNASTSSHVSPARTIREAGVRKRCARTHMRAHAHRSRKASVSRQNYGEERAESQGCIAPLP